MIGSNQKYQKQIWSEPVEMNMTKRVAVLGAGPSGLAQLRAFQSARENGEEILLSGPSTTSVSVQWRSPNWLRFSPDGEAWPNGHFRICSNDFSKARAVIIYRTGRVRVDDRSPSGGAVLC